MRLKLTDHTAHAHGSRRPCYQCAEHNAYTTDARVTLARTIQTERDAERANMRRVYNNAKRLTDTNWLAIYSTLLETFLAGLSPVQRNARIAEVSTERRRYARKCYRANVAPDYAQHLAEWLMVRSSDDFIREYEVEPELTPIQEEQARYAQATAVEEDEYDGYSGKEWNELISSGALR